MSSPLLRAEHLSRILDGEVPVTLIKDASLEIMRGEFVAVCGPSGSGKSSLLYLLGLLDVPSSGRIFLDGAVIEDYREDNLARLRLGRIGFVFQFHFLLPEFTALENVMLPMQRLGRLAPDRMKRRATELLEGLGLAEQIHKVPKQMSGGQSQRVAIARALANEPALILADEPTGNLDSHSSKNVQNILRGLAETGNHSVVVVTHDTQFAESAFRQITVVDGMIQGDRNLSAQS